MGNAHRNRIDNNKKERLQSTVSGENEGRQKELLKLFVKREIKNMYELASSFSQDAAIESIKQVLSNNLMDPKELVTDLGIDDKVVLTALNVLHGSFLPDSYSDDSKNFMKNSRLVFENEDHFKSSYLMHQDRVGSEKAATFDYLPASQKYVALFCQMYKHLSGKKFASPEELKSNFRSVIQGKKILELGCGPGFALRVLNNLDANVSGVEIDLTYKDKSQGLNIIYGDASKVLDTLKGKGEKFDVIFSVDFFSTTILSMSDAMRIMGLAGDLMDKSTLSIHQIMMEKLHPVVQDFNVWMNCRRRGLDYNEFKALMDSQSEERKQDTYTNKPNFSKECLLALGFDIINYSKDGWYFNMVLKKK